MRETVAQLVESETIKVRSRWFESILFLSLFLQKGADGCLSNNLTYYYAIRIDGCVVSIRLEMEERAWKNRAIRYGLLMSWKDTSSVDFIQKSGTVEDFIIFVGDFRRMMDRFSKINPDNNFMFFSSSGHIHRCP